VKEQWDLRKDQSPATHLKRDALNSKPWLQPLKELQARNNYLAVMNTVPQNDLVASVCATLNSVIQYGDAYQLADYVVVEPPFEDPEVDTFIAFLRHSYSAEDETSDQRIEDTIRQVVTETEESEDSEGRPVQSWSSMVTFLLNWMVFLRDVDVEKDNYLEIYQRLKDLLE